MRGERKAEGEGGRKLMRDGDGDGCRELENSVCVCTVCVCVLTSTHDLGGRVGPITTLLSRESEDQAADAVASL